jgi:predicted Rossmann fold nucleotide-binding protein DprA/Smf involved in DNA uptake
MAAGMSPAPAGPGSDGSSTESLTGEERKVFDSVAWQPTLLSQVVDRTGLTVGAVSRALESLEATGQVDREQQWWVRRV